MGADAGVPHTVQQLPDRRGVLSTLDLKNSRFIGTVIDHIGWELGAKIRKIRLGAAGIFTYEGRCRGVNGYDADVCFASESGGQV